ncbi:hypothetical protein B0H66DRAFT_203071 [Apodospora peruviana]|uniref:Uncharacterized protein n=1 Tax=Apodospora peruviana TaxID=516989 RepID=A0AAE0M850_9PEZI|nr:hypothetical protein B0H66DRAFT_203071 [Apodospora peruviana]
MPHMTTTNAAVALDGVRPAEAETHEVLPDDAVVHQPGPVKPRTNGKKGRQGARSNGSGTKPQKPAVAAPKLSAGRRKKLFDHPRTQAAYERAQDLKHNFGAVQKALKAPLNEMADRSINQLLEDPAAMERTPEFTEAQSFLDCRLADRQRQIHSRREIELRMAERVWHGEAEAAKTSTNRRIAELCEEAYGQLLDQTNILERLRANNLPIDLPAAGEKENYLYKEISQEEADTQGPFIENINGRYVPISGRPVSELMSKKHELPLEVSPKRKAQDQPDGQPAAKMAASTKDEDGVPKMPRHAAGLLAAVEALEERDSETPPPQSSAPTPPAEPIDAPSPGNVDLARISGLNTPKDPLEIPVPRGASAADEHGVRIISRKATQMTSPNNRIMVPMHYQFEDHEIGFRDSTNSLQKGATKARRGRYIDKPNSNYLFIDRRVGNWDATVDNDFDQDLIKKHRLHPTLGIVLPTSVNEWEPPKPVEMGWKPVVLVAPDGTETHASRTIKDARQDRKLEEAEKQAALRQKLLAFCKEQGIAEEEIAPDQDITEENRRKVLISKDIDPDKETPREEVQQDTPEPTTENLAVFNGFVEEALHAASTIDAEEEAERVAAAQRSQPAQSSRPYDAIRDVFTDNAPAILATQIAPTAGQDDTLAAVNSFNLSFLADVAEQKQQGFYHPAQPSALPVQTAPVPTQDMSSIDPSLFGQVHPDDPVARPTGLEQAAPIRHAEYAQHTDGTGRMPPFIQQNDNDFLRTTLNPQPNYPPQMGSMQEYNPSTGEEYQDAGNRTPFSNNGAAKGLPALRPVRSLLNDSPPPPEPQGSPVPQHPNMVVSNSGAFFPPAPNRPFHTGFSVQEQVPVHPMQPVMQPQPLAAPFQGSPMTGPQAPQQQRQMSPYGSPSSYHNVPAPLGPTAGTASSAPIPISASSISPPPPLAPAPFLPPGQSQLPIVPGQALPATPSPRSRPGSSSAASASAKYRKLEPAPTPPHRIGYAGNGQELRTVQFDYREAIKDYTPSEAPPQHGPTHIRGWTHNTHSNIKKSRPSIKRDPGADDPS